jgi:hypothetical protein
LALSLVTAFKGTVAVIIYSKPHRKISSEGYQIQWKFAHRVLPKICY